jgi:DNA-binding SARP family transcriptional activator
MDLAQLSRRTTNLIDGRADAFDLETIEFNPPGSDLLPGWYEEWVIFERERLRQRLLHAMESLVRRLISHNRLADAVQVAVTAVGVEPLRESAQRLAN